LIVGHLRPRHLSVEGAHSITTTSSGLVTYATCAARRRPPPTGSSAQQRGRYSSPVQPRLPVGQRRQAFGVRGVLDPPGSAGVLRCNLPRARPLLEVDHQHGVGLASRGPRRSRAVFSDAVGVPAARASKYCLPGVASQPCWAIVQQSLRGRSVRSPAGNHEPDVGTRSGRTGLTGRSSPHPTIVARWPTPRSPIKIKRSTAAALTSS
jgi:hypothetical protein